MSASPNPHSINSGVSSPHNFHDGVTEIQAVNHDRRSSDALFRQSSVLNSKINNTVELKEDSYGICTDDAGKPHAVKRFTWKNHNKIEVQVISYGARIISMKFPDRKGQIDDVVLGYDDFSSYQNSNINFGGTIGRVTGTIEKGTFVMHKKQYWLKPNHKEHHRDGGKNGYDKRLWQTYVEGKKVHMSLSSDDHLEGYPGTVLIHITFELTTGNEFKIVMKANTSDPTIINLSNLTYLNLAGHHAGAEEIYHHILTLNCNCFTKQIGDLPTGEIMNVVHTKYDFQVPKILGKIINCNPKEGLDQNFCVNRGITQDDCFVSRLLHPKTGRLIEIYSNQPGVRVETANDWGNGKIKRITERSETSFEEPISRCLKLANELHETVMTDLQEDCQKEYSEIRLLLSKVGSFIRRTFDVPDDPNVSESSVTGSNEEASHPVMSISAINHLTPAQENYLQKMLVRCDEKQSQDYSEIADIIRKILVRCLVSTFEMGFQEGETRENEEKPNSIQEVEVHDTTPEVPRVKIYKDGRIHGKENTIYHANCGVAIQTQNYPNAINMKDFPKCILNPGQTYKHTITYKFWIRSGQPAKWLRRNRDV